MKFTVVPQRFSYSVSAAVETGSIFPAKVVPEET